MAAPDLSVIVPFLNAGATLERCLAALEHQSLPRKRYEIIAVDNNSVDGSAGIVGRYPGVELLSESSQGAYAARNRGVASARGSILAFTDPDCVPATDWLEVIACQFNAAPAEVLIGGYVLPSHSRALELLVLYENTKDAFVFTTGIPELYYGHTNNMAVRRAAFDRFGPFLERRRGADTIFVRKVVGSLPCSAVRYEPAMRVHHLELDGVGTYYRKVATYGHSRESYRHISWTRPLSLSERAEVMRRMQRQHRLGPAQLLLLTGLLAAGLAAWQGGRLVARARRLTSARPESA